jgi:hypothetical protein
MFEAYVQGFRRAKRKFLRIHRGALRLLKVVKKEARSAPSLHK